MTGYEKSPDYGGRPPPRWLDVLMILILVLTVIGLLVRAILSSG